MVALETKWHGPTNTRGSRISCTRMDADQTKHEGAPNRVTVSVDDGWSGEAQHVEAVRAFCARYNWHGTLACGGTTRGHVWVFLPRSASVAAADSSSIYEV